MQNDIRSSLIVKDLEVGKITFDEFQRKCLEWAFEIWDTFQPLQFPFKSEKVVTHFNISLEDRKKLDFGYYLDNQEVSKWLDRANFTVHHNLGVIEWLEDMLLYCQVAEENAKVKTKITEYKKAAIAQAIELNKKYLVSFWLEEEAEVKEYRDYFRGRVV